MGSTVGVKFEVKGPMLKLMGGQMYVNPRLREKVQDFSPWFKEAQDKGRLAANFMAVWAEGQDSWPPISSKYVKWKVKQGFSPRVMQMRNWTLHAMISGQLNVQTNTEWRWGIDAGNSMWYQGKSTMPYPERAAQTRPFAIILDGTMKTMLRDLKKYIYKLFRK